MDVGMESGETVLREKFGTADMAAKLEERGISETITLLFKMFIESSDFFFLATSNRNGEADCSFRGGERGLVRVIDHKSLLFPDYPGNGLFQSLGNLLENPHIGMLFIDFEKGQRLRVNGTAELMTDDSDLAMYPGALSVVKVSVCEVYTNCSGRIPKMVRVSS
jgi:predicted pyridoxine 5'-phosphate oxidase superfamily flavin-nucleotide-binding protein